MTLQEFPWDSPWGTPSGKGVYLTVYPSFCPNTDTLLCLTEDLNNKDWLHQDSTMTRLAQFGHPKLSLLGNFS